MCRRCGESDKRGPAHQRRQRRVWLLTTYGDGTTAHCWLCDVSIDSATLTVDRLVAGGSYAHWNIRPACLPCNIGRSDRPAAEECMYG